MKKQNILFIILAVIVIAGGIWFFTKEDNEKINNDTAIEDENNEVETPSEDADVETDTEDKTDEDKVADESNDETSDEGSDGTTSDIDVGKPAPDFNIKTLSGENVSLSDYEGKIVLVNFWATWCGFCVKEMPDLDKFDKEHDDVVVLAIDVMEEEDKVREYIEGGGYSFDVGLDLDGEVAKDYLISAYPTSYFIDTDGSLIGRVPGMLEYEQMLEILESIRAER